MLPIENPLSLLRLLLRTRTRVLTPPRRRHLVIVLWTPHLVPPTGGLVLAVVDFRHDGFRIAAIRKTVRRGRFYYRSHRQIHRLAYHNRLAYAKDREH